MKLNTNPKVTEKIASYPEAAKTRLLYLRQLIIATAEQIGDIQEMEETLKWGEPSYLVKKGSTIRMDWKSKKPDQVALYFKCTSKLVPTFKTLYPEIFDFETTRAIALNLTGPLPVQELSHCIALALQYHRLKHLPLLGAES